MQEGVAARVRVCGIDASLWGYDGSNRGVMKGEIWVLKILRIAPH